MASSIDRGADARDRTLRRWVVVAALAPPLALAAAEAYVFGDLAGFPLDDAWIHLVFARSLAAGDGLAYEAGRLVAGSTAPLWTALVALLHLLPGAVVIWTKALGVAAHAATVALSYTLARRLALAPPRAVLVALLVALTDGLVWSALSGMEIGLFTALALGGIVRHVDERRTTGAPPLSFLLFGLAALARPEGLLLPVLAAVDRAVATRAAGPGLAVSGRGARRALLGLLLAALVVVPVGLVYLAASGSPLPTTLGAKSSGPPAFVPELRFLDAIFSLLFAAQPLPALLAAGGAVVLVGRLGGERDRGLLLPLWCFGLPIAAAMLSSGEELLIGNFGRYFFPLLPPVVLLGVLALERVRLERVRSVALGRWRLPLAAVLLLALIAPPALRTVRGGALYLQARANVEDADLAAARWLEHNVAEDALLGLCDIGLVKWLRPNPIVDLAGIVSPERRRFFERMREEHELPWPNALRLWLEQKRPEIVVVYPSWFPLLEAEPSAFPVLHRIRIPNNVAAAGDELVIYATPWTRESTLRASEGER